MARVRMGAMAVAFGIQHDLDLECLVHVTTRDRNLMALESELLGAHALGVRNILALTGDPPRIGDYPTGSGVWDVDSIGLIEILARLNRGEDQAGSPIGQQATFTIACALDPTAADTKTEWDRLERKLAAGAHLVMTQPLYDAAQVETMLAESRRRFGPRGFPVPLLLGVLPLVSARHAEFLHNEVPGITIPEATRARMRAAGAAGHRGRDRHGRRAPGGRRERGVRHLPDAQLRPLRAGGGAGPPDPRAPPDGGGGGLVTTSRTHGFAVAGGLAVAIASIGPRDARPRRRAPPRRGPPFPPPVEDQAVYDTAGAFRPGTVEQVEAMIDAIERRTGAEIAVYTQLVALLRDDRRGGAQRPGADGPVGRRAGPGSTTASSSCSTSARTTPATARCSCTPAPATPPSSCRTRSARRSSRTTCCRCSSAATSTGRC